MFYQLAFSDLDFNSFQDCSTFFQKNLQKISGFFGKTLATIGAIKILLQNKIVFFQKLLHLLLFHAGISNTGDCETLTSALVCALECARVSERVCVDVGANVCWRK